VEKYKNMPSKIEERLWISAKYLAQESSMEYTVPCNTIIRDFIRAGAQNMLREKRTSDPDFEEADLNLGRFVAAMVVEATRIPNTRASLPGPLLIREASFVKAKEICPLWPFC
jgi:hypothetical protein